MALTTFRSGQDGHLCIPGVVGTPLAKLLEFGRPFDDIAVKSVLKNVADISLNNNFDQFKRSVQNLKEIVKVLQQSDENYAGRDLKECAHDYYMAFYLNPEIRQKCKFQLRPCAIEFQDRLLGFLSMKTANKLRRFHSTKRNHDLISCESDSSQDSEDLPSGIVVK
ncbi:protein telomere ends associated-like isoform X2 [Drosophila ficusphila]|uniref:protein telomere ends associated-like isoform X2 n=1 Tax=Drosophila ficusphila TaxID=30025 RepID=UPI001C894490|nr:protein telomere ends associated-like isoform X2 [Drosophila ficusphila]